MGISQLIVGGSIRTMYQPIVRLQDGAVQGYEALSRGPVGELEDPRVLFARAVAAGRVDELERACVAAAVRNSTALPKADGHIPQLFVNVLPQSLLSDAFLEALEAELEACAMPVERVVIEITEGQRIDDLRAFARRLAIYRGRGFQIALDDVGAGHAGLETFVELEPDIIKLDRAIVGSSDRHPARRSIIEACVLIARRRAVQVVAEGIEHPGELRLARDLGVTLGQGYLIGRPAAVASVSGAPGQLAIRSLREMERFGLQHGSGWRAGGVPIGDLATSAPTVRRAEPLRDALPHFDGTAEAVVVVEGDEPQGILERTRVYEMLARPYGREVNLRRPVEEVVDSDILVVDCTENVETVSRLAMGRSAETVYSHIAVVEDGRYAGVVSVRRLLDAITSLRIEAASAANPLTGLPGNPVIEAVLRSHLGEARSIGIVHADLDDFKAFNDAHGFHHGDAAIRFTAELVSEVVSASGGPGSFVGHIGGDDFVAIVAADRLQEIVSRLQYIFRKRVRSLDFGRGAARFDPASGPGLDITVAAIVVSGACDRHPARVLDMLAEAKREAKMQARRRRMVGRERS